MELINQTLWLSIGTVGSIILFIIIYMILKLVALFKISNNIDKLTKTIQRANK